MATILDKDVIRESTIKIDNREVIITLSSDQKIQFKLKGMKSGHLTIDIETLYNQLSGNGDDSLKKDNKEPKSISIISGSEHKIKNTPMISLHDIRHRFNVEEMDYTLRVKFDGIMKELIENAKKK